MNTRAMSALALILAMSLGPEAGLAQVAAPAVSAPAEVQLSRDQITVLRAALDDAPAQGFSDKEFTPAGLDALLASSNPAEQRRGQMLLKNAILRYAAAVHRGRLANSSFDDDWGVRPAAFDPAPTFARAVADNRIKEWLASLPPQYAGYRQLVKSLATYRAIAARGGWNQIPAGKPLKSGMKDARVPPLRARLAAEDPMVDMGKASADTMDAPMVEALKAFQRRHGLKDDGEMGKPSLAALNAPVGQRILQIIANMERWRWLPPELPADRVQVNAAAAVTTVFKDGKPVLFMKATAGRVTDRTPMLMSQIKAVVINPPWNIPKSIADKEIYAKERASPGYMAREDIHVIRTADGGTRLQQAAGPKSALGHLKFDFDNPYGVYLHDTPSKSAFDRSVRTVSHGCVRLEKPRDLAVLVMDGWDLQKIDAAIATRDTRRVTLAKPVSVVILYWTAFVGSDGAMNFRADPYDWDHDLLQRISAQKYSNA